MNFNLDKLNPFNKKEEYSFSTETSGNKLMEKIELENKIEETSKRVGIKAEKLKAATERFGGLEEVKKYFEQKIDDNTNQGDAEISQLLASRKKKLLSTIYFFGLAAQNMVFGYISDNPHFSTIAEIGGVAIGAIGIMQIILAKSDRRKAEYTAALMDMTGVDRESKPQ